ncbi:sigma-70 family RNA polymerase sigma factor [Cutibacterium sp. WCA-380-WT-3A]|uniref:Sigma-70 family RNA polymerase sigma factor n=1 Tax=Cutibacterium porci TaxID=2605781 RepID=A0A7K0J7H9_9ACTN|nr:sigma-70 family RNA polymerase sigma factor [Cutibacterium porci]MSS45688.1 sigma-70 family RNA polymerase sigma factor [Cutibacterium porci]
MRYTEFIDGAVALDSAQERELFRKLDAGAIADAVLEGYFVAAVPASETELRKISDDGAAARQVLWRYMLALVLTQARQAAVTYRCSVEDFIQAGCIGLGEAIDRYDERRGARFSTVAWTWIRRRIGEEAVRLSGARSRAVMREAAEVARVEEELTARWQRVPSSNAIAAQMGKDVMWVEKRRVECWEVETSFFEQMAVVHTCCDEPESGLISLLTGQERRIVEMRHGFHGEPMTITAVADKLGLSASNARRIEHRALARLRRHLQRVVAA